MSKLRSTLRRIVYSILAVSASIGFALWRFSIDHYEEIKDEEHWDLADREGCDLCTGEE